MRHLHIFKPRRTHPGFHGAQHRPCLQRPLQPAVHQRNQLGAACLDIRQQFSGLPAAKTPGIVQHHYRARIKLQPPAPPVPRELPERAAARQPCVPERIKPGARRRQTHNLPVRAPVDRRQTRRHQRFAGARFAADQSQPSRLTAMRQRHPLART